MHNLKYFMFEQFKKGHFSYKQSLLKNEIIFNLQDY